MKSKVCFNCTVNQEPVDIISYVTFIDELNGLTLTLKSDRDLKGDLEVFFCSWTGGGGSGLAAASRVPVLEGSTFFYEMSIKMVQMY